MKRLFFLLRRLKVGIEKFFSCIGNEKTKEITQIFRINYGDNSWRFEDEKEFFIDYKPGIYIANLDISYQIEGKGSIHFRLYYEEPNTFVEVKLPDRINILEVFDIFDINSEKSRIQIKEETIIPRVSIFIGHGRNQMWRDLKDHLQDKHGLPIIAYEIGSRAGHSIRDILESMLNESNLAFLIMTGEDEMPDGSLQARQNVIHEIGLFQGKLGFSKAIILLEEGTEEFSNIHGIQQIRFSKGNIKETFGDVLAVIKRETKK